jgi:hypothetical protein
MKSADMYKPYSANFFNRTFLFLFPKTDLLKIMPVQPIA